MDGDHALRCQYLILLGCELMDAIAFAYGDFQMQIVLPKVLGVHEDDQPMD